jgi:hypothetical protein
MAQLETLEAKVRTLNKKIEWTHGNIFIFYNYILILLYFFMQMASIEVSLSSTSLGPAGPGIRRPKRSAASPVSLLSRTPPSTLLVRAASPATPVAVTPPPSNRDSAAAARELEALRNALRDKENVIHR